MSAGSEWSDQYVINWFLIVRFENWQVNYILGAMNEAIVIRIEVSFPSPKHLFTPKMNLRASPPEIVAKYEL